jgi:ABC-type multidrug transport system fused ATPase/permease subunit
MENAIALPPTLKELYALFSNPAVMVVAISLVLESLAWIKDATVPNILKLGAVWLAGVVWSASVALLGLLIDPASFALSWGSVYGVLVAGTAAAASMAVFNKIYSDLPQPVKDFILALFGRNTITVTATNVGDTFASTSTSVERVTGSVFSGAAG